MRARLSSPRGLHTAVRHALLLNGFIDLLNEGRGRARKGCVHFLSAARKPVACEDLALRHTGDAGPRHSLVRAVFCVV